MNCRTFQKNLEDYLADGLDFAGRFGMERHARQCISCGKEMCQNCWRGVAPSTSAASYMSEEMDCMRAKMNRNDKGK